MLPTAGRTPALYRQPQGAVIPPQSGVAGVPGQLRRELSDDEIAHIRVNAVLYQELVGVHRDAGNV